MTDIPDAASPHEGRLLYHGGNLAAARALFPGAPEPFLDLSTGINPDSYPVPPLASEIWARLPEPGRLVRLERIAAQRYGVPEGAAIVAAPGTQALIQALPRVRRARTVGILGFTYGEYERVWRGAGVAPCVVETPEALAGFDLAILCNPNNPDGRLIQPRELTALAGTMARRGGKLVVDEAFVDVMPAGASLIPSLPHAALVLRSFGKPYGLAGVRLGFAVGDAALIGAFRAALGPWAVSGPAIEIGCAALADEFWLARSVAALADRAAALDRVLRENGVEPVGGTPLFRLARHQEAHLLFQALGRQGVLVRHFSARPEWLRLGLPADEAGLDRLAQALRKG